MANPNPIKKIKTLAGTVGWQIDGRRFGASPARPQFKTKEKAEIALAEMIARRGAGLRPDRRDITFGMQSEAYLRDNATALAGKTIRSYASLLRAHLLAPFGNRRITEITTAEIKQFLARKSATKKVIRVIAAGSGERRGRTSTIPVADFDPATMRALGNEREGQLKPTSVKQLRAMLSIIFQSAVDDNLLSTNPVTAARSGARGRAARMARRPAVTKEKPFTEDQRDALLRWCGENDAELGEFLFLLFKTGCRIGEARALRWGDVHPAHICIERNIDDRNVVTLTKTGPARLVELADGLKKVLAARFKERQRTGHAVGADDYIFGNGEPIPVRKLTRRFEKPRVACNLSGHRMYDTRATFASVLLSRNAPLLWVSKMLGHSTAETTLRCYAEWMPAESAGHIGLLDA